MVLRLCAIKISNRDYNILPQQHGSTNVKEILYSMNKGNIKELINSKSVYLGPVLRMINTNISKLEDVVARRKVNKNFIHCLMEVEIGAMVFIWLERNLDQES